jgi:hemerythrin
MDSFVWDKQFETGLSDVDEQHHILVNLINRFGELLTISGVVSFADIETVFGELAEYAKYHFQDEELLMERERVDSRFVEKHKKLHHDFLQELTQMHAGVGPHQQDSAKSLLKFLIYWLAFHILGTDQSLARQIKSIQSGQNPADAYLDETRMKETATEPLLLALNGLFQQVSERNRELIELNLTLEKKVVERTHALSEANKRLEELAMTDVLTGLPNRRQAMARLAQVWAESSKEDTSIACMMIDADGFKQINDNFGHDAGDEVLRQLSKNLSYSVRTDDIVCRLGGDEFLILCPKTTLDGALHAAELIRNNISSLRVSAGTGVWSGSVSIGVAERTPEMHGAEDLIKAADEGVYISKRKGRNRVESFQRKC